ncbi:MAG: helix-turn-helix domain-containing protein [Chitinophagaceae bacterium]
MYRTAPFVKFFKRGMGKTFSDYVNTIRIGNACHLSSETCKTIAKIAFTSGFESLTYFNGIFFKKEKSAARRI